MNTQQAVQRLREVVRRQHKAISTESSYVFWLRRYSGVLTSEQKLERFLTELARDRCVSAVSQNQAFNAILFFYRDVLGQPLQDVIALRATRPARMRTAPSIEHTQALLKTIRNLGGYPTNLIARLLYGCGLRVSEPLNLRIKDVDLRRSRLCIRGAKGGKDRVVALPASLIPEIAKQLHHARAIWEGDQRTGTPLALPEGLAKKYPEFQFNWMWAWLFPAHHVCRHPRTGVLVRYRMHEANVQRAVKYARRQLGICVLPHELRHGYATHCLERGVNPRAIQAAMGHVSLETTMGYLHAESLSVRSPLEALEATPLPVGPFDNLYGTVNPIAPQSPGVRSQPHASR
jgi:integron integrase